MKKSMLRSKNPYLAFAHAFATLLSATADMNLGIHPTSGDPFVGQGGEESLGGSLLCRGRERDSG